MFNVLGNLIHDLRAGLADWRHRNRAYAELAALDDRSLADMGITRSEIPYVLSQAQARHDELGAPANSNVRRAA